MPRTGRRFTAGVVAHFEEPFAPTLLVGWAVGLALVPIVLLRLLPTLNPDSWRPAKVVIVLLVAVLGGVLAWAQAWVVQTVGGMARHLAVRHVRAARITGGAAVAVVVLLAAAGVVAAGWSGEPAGAAGATAVRTMCAVLAGTSAALLMLEGVLIDAWGRGVRLAPVLAAYCSVACFLVFDGEEFGPHLVILTLVIPMLGGGSPQVTPARTGLLLGCEVLLAVLAVSIAGDSATARALAQAVLGIAAGMVTSLWAMRFARWHGRLLRFGSAAAIVPLAFVLFVWFDGQLLGGGMELPLFVPMAWLVIRVWRRMQASDRTLVSAAADIVFAVLLGVLAVLFLLWLANLLHLPDVEVKALRAAAGHLGVLIDLPWWQWASADAVLAAVFLTAALRRGRRSRITAAADRIRLSGALGGLRRTMSVVKTVLLSAVFLGLAGPPAVGPVLSQVVQERYTADLQRDLVARRQTAVYQGIIQQFTSTPQSLPVLAQLMIQVHDSTGGSAEADHQIPAEELAYWMGQLQAQTLLPFALRDEEPSREEDGRVTAAAVQEAGMSGSATDAADLTGRLTRAENEETGVRQREQAAERASEHAAAVVTAALGNFAVGHGAVIGLVREYLDGLAESRLGEIFLQWTDRGLHGPAPEQPPAVERLVEPDPAALQNEADNQLTDELITQGVLSDPEQARAERESPIAGAVDMAAHTRGLQQGTAPCFGCEHLHLPGDENHLPREREPVGRE